MYSNSNEYRNFLRHLAKMDASNYPVFGETDDEETLDEFLYDSDAMMNYMNAIFAITKQSPLFMKLYRLAAEKMLSTDPEIGLAIMYSYDYLDLFFPFLYMYLREQNSELHTHFEFQWEPEPVDEKNTYYRNLIQFMEPTPSPLPRPQETGTFPTKVRKL